jgi:hypothetical protein
MRNRPFGVTLLALIVLFFAAAGLARSIQALQKWEFLKEILPIWPGYLVVSGLFWFAAGVALFWALWMMHPKAGLYLLVGISLYSLTFWMEQMWLQMTIGITGKIVNWPFLVTINLLIVAWSLWEFYVPGMRKRSEERYEQQSEN